MRHSNDYSAAGTVSDMVGDNPRPVKVDSEKAVIQKYLRGLRKRAWIILLFSALVTALVGFYAFTATPVYSATSRLLLEPQGQNVVSIDELVAFDTQGIDSYETQYELLKSRGLAHRVISELNLWSHPELAQPEKTKQPGSSGLVATTSEPKSATQNVSADTLQEIKEVESLLSESGFGNESVKGSDILQLPDSQQAVIDRFMERFSLRPVANTKLVMISYESANPALASRVANAIASQHILRSMDEKVATTDRASAWLNDRLASLKKTLDDSEQRLIDFKESNDLIDVGGSVGRLNEQELLITSEELGEARSELAVQRSLLSEVQSLSNQPELLLTIPAFQSDTLVQRTKIELDQAQRELGELRNRYGARHPRVVDLNSRLTTLANSLQSHISRVRGSIASDTQAALQRVVSVEQTLAAGKKQIQALGSKQFELDALEREVISNRDIYNTFFNRITEANSADGLERANARITDFAVTPSKPIKPKKEILMLLAAVASLLLSGVVALLLEMFDDTVQGPEDIETSLGSKVLGVLPFIESSGLFRSAKGKRVRHHPEDFSDPDGLFVESVNSIRTALVVDSENAKNQVMLVASSVPGEGKSTTALHLAYSMAAMERVLLIDADLRRPSIARTAGIDTYAPGLTSLIGNSASPRECINKGLMKVALDILPSGPLPAQPMMYMSSPRFEAILVELRKHYDRIIIDCPPTQAVSDTLLLSKLADGVIFAVKSSDTPIDVIKRGLERMRQAKANIIGIVVTQVDYHNLHDYGADHYYTSDYDSFYDEQEAYYGDERGSRSKRRSHAPTTSRDYLRKHTKYAYTG